MTLIETLIGRRVIKTALSVFFTALICQTLNIPAVFAVMTAIVTVEPTAQDSFKKGLVRFPASAIGSLYAATFFHFFHISPLSYALAALFTIVTCYRLKLFDGLLVATLTSVAMVYVIDGRPIDAFFVRLLTTTIGLSVSTLVNFIILPPNYLKQITSEMDDVLYLAGIDLGYFAVSLRKRELDLIQAQTRKVFDTFQARLLKVEQLILNQQKESVYHNALYKQKTNIEWSEETHQDVVTIVDDLSSYLKQPKLCDKGRLNQHLHTLNQTFSQSAKREVTLTDYLHAETVILYELIQLTELMRFYQKLEATGALL